MLAGGVLLVLTSAALGEFRGFHPYNVSRGAWLALLYLILAGSVLAFTAYVWLIHHESPTKVGTYAYVNPLVAVLVGYFFGGETLGSEQFWELCSFWGAWSPSPPRARKSGGSPRGGRSGLRGAAR